MPRGKAIFVSVFALGGGLLGFYVQDKLLQDIEERKRLDAEAEEKEENVDKERSS